MDVFAGEVARMLYSCCVALGLLGLAFLIAKWVHDAWHDDYLD